MKKILLFLFCCTVIFSSRAQTVLFSENFNSGSASQFVLNTTDLGGAGLTLSGRWIINNAYTGDTGTGTFKCENGVLKGTDIGIDFYCHTAFPQPAAIAGNPHSYYMHIYDTTCRQVGISEATFTIADNICVPAATNFAKMSTGINTIGHTNVSLSFWWVCGGDVNVYGKVYYSVDGGNTWLPVSYGIYYNSQTWQQSILSRPEFNNQADLRFGFQWVNGVATINAVRDPSFAIDDVQVTADAAPTCNANFLLYPDSLVSHLWYAVNLSNGTSPVNYVWNWGDGTYTAGTTPVHIYANPGMYNICLSLSDGAGCSSTHCDSAKVYRTDGTAITVNVILPDYPTAVQQVQQTNSITIYPNPSGDNITISGTGDDIISEIAISNVLGQTVLSSTVNKNFANNIPLQLPKTGGLYFIHLKGAKGDYTGKVVRE